jgi:phenylalanyl-tRNA synthetase beta chain
MNTSLSWIRRYVPDLDADSEEYCDAMTLAGTKVEGFRRLDKNLSKIVVGRILTCDEHPDSDHLHVCKVDIGGPDALQIVCGAPNVREGQKVPVVLDGGMVAGSRKSGLSEEGIPISRGELRGVMSEGMICSIDELGSDHEFYPEAPSDGIYVFPEDTPVGSDAVEALGLHDTVVEYEITSNRVDCYSVIGIAREAAAVFHKEFHPPVIKKTGNAESVSDYVTVDVEDPDLCPRYTARVVKNVKIGPSPKWMQRCLASQGIRPINNIVDITNFIMAEYGQPMHSYDYDEIKGNKIIVKRAKDGEVFRTLDGQDRMLDKNVLMIADGERYVGIAGIMGGEDSMIKEDIRTVLFEAACFDGTNIRLSAKRIGLQTDASQKFDKGLDPNTAEEAMNRACELMEEFGAGEVVGGIADVYPVRRMPAEVPFEPDRINEMLGTEIPASDMIRFFESEELSFDKVKNTIVAPTFRQDILRTCDLAEEVARFYGYAKIPSTLPKGSATAGGLEFKMRIEALARDAAEHCGFSEGYCYSFESPRVFDKLLFDGDAKERRAITIRNPLGPDFSIMRTSSLNGILTSLAGNYSHRMKNVRLYELGNIYLADELPLKELPDERKMLTYGMYGDGDFFAMKGAVLVFFEKLGIDLQTVEWKADEKKNYYHPGRQAAIYIGNVKAGEIGEIHPTVLKNYGIGERVLAAVLDLNTLTPMADFSRKYQGIAKYPAMTRDLSMIVPKEITHRSIEKVILEQGGSILESTALFDVYEGASIQSGYRSMAYTMTFRHKDKTLEEAEVAEAMARILKSLGDMGIELRK